MTSTKYDLFDEIGVNRKKYFGSNDTQTFLKLVSSNDLKTFNTAGTMTDF